MKVIHYFITVYGFRKLRSNELANIAFVEKVLKGMDGGSVSWWIVIDLSKAFDPLDHNILFKKLELCGLSNATKNRLKTV